RRGSRADAAGRHHRARAGRRSAQHARGRRVLRRVRRDLGRPRADPRRLGRRVPDRRPGAEDARRPAALRLPPALRAQGPLLADDGAGALARRAAPARRPARHGRDRAPGSAGGAAGVTSHGARTEPSPAFRSRVRMHSYESQTQWTWGAAVAISSVLARDLQEKPRARLLLSGGSTPAPVYAALSK